MAGDEHPGGRSAHAKSSSLVSLRTTVGWRFSRCGKKEISPSRWINMLQHACGFGEQPDADDEQRCTNSHRQAELALGHPPEMNFRIPGIGVAADADEHAGNDQERQQYDNIKAVVLECLQHSAACAPSRIVRHRERRPGRRGMESRGENRCFCMAWPRIRAGKNPFYQWLADELSFCGSAFSQHVPGFFQFLGDFPNFHRATTNKRRHLVIINIGLFITPRGRKHITHLQTVRLCQGINRKPHAQGSEASANG